MDPLIVFSFVSAAAIIWLIVARQSASEKVRLILGGVAVAAALIAVALIFDKN
jgi:ABC-type enterobactin transport system permease subunit